MELEFITPKQSDGTVNLLLYGEPGSGKSTAAATAPGPIVWVNYEGPGALGYARKIATRRGTAINEVRVHPSEARTVLTAVAQYVDKNEVGTVVIDTIGKLRDSIAYQVGGDTPSIKQWGEVAKIIEKFIVHMRDADCNLVLIAHESISEDGEERIINPLIGGSMTQKIQGEVDVVAYCGVSKDDKGNPQYGAQLVAGKGRRAKDRSDSLGSWRLLDLEDWIKTYNEGLK